MNPRCSFQGCFAKLDLISQSLICKCEKTFCSLHRQAETHKCSHDYKAEGEKNLMKHMSTPLIAKKVDVI